MRTSAASAQAFKLQWAEAHQPQEFVIEAAPLGLAAAARRGAATLLPAALCRCSPRQHCAPPQGRSCLLTVTSRQAYSCHSRKERKQVTEDAAWDDHREVLPVKWEEGSRAVRDCELESCFSRASLEAASLAFSCPKPSRACTCTHQLARVSCSMPKQPLHGPGIPEKACKSSHNLCLSQGIQCIFLPNRHMSKCICDR